MKQKNHANWYVEVALNDDMAIRYYYLFRNKPQLNNQWVIKFLSKKGIPQYKTVDEQTAMLIIKSHNKSLKKDKREYISKAVGKNDFVKVDMTPVMKYTPPEVTILSTKRI